MARPPVDAQTVSDTGLEIFEAVATLEYAGRSPSRSAIAAAARRDQALVDEALDDMTAQGLLTRSNEEGEPVYIPARRDWSTQPDQAAGHPME
jgi:ABC-type cobalamin/Fe3+-siderophores transport system ATPase subunit